MEALHHPTLNVIGLMSGTSVDGIDAACIRVSLQTQPLKLASFELLGTATLDIPPVIRDRLLVTMTQKHCTLEDLCALKVEMGSLFAEAALQLIGELGQKGIAVDLIASHGQTLFHLPPVNGKLGSTLQIGEPAIIAEKTGLEVAADFRPGDMAAGGHGAPLVPFADRLLFQDAHVARALQNIGGIANLTALPAISASETPLLALDTGPGNMLIDAAMEHFFSQPYDPNGEMAASGTIHQGLLETLLADPYFSLAPPKSTGRERFGKQYALQVIKQWHTQMEPQDLVATLTALTAQTIADAYRQFVLPSIPVQEVVVAGGGVMNATLMRWLEERLTPMGIALKIVEDFGLSSKYKEAVAFALLGYARKFGIPCNVPSCTGANRPVPLGGLWVP